MPQVYRNFKFPKVCYTYIFLYGSRKCWDFKVSNPWQLPREIAEKCQWIRNILLTLCSIAILRTAGAASTLAPPPVVCWGGDGEAVDWGIDAWEGGGGGGSGSSIACVGFGFCCAAMTSSAGLGPTSTS